MCTFSSRVRRGWYIQSDFGGITVGQVRAGGSDLKLHGSSLVSVFGSREQRNPGITDNCEPSTVHGAKVTAHYNTNSTSLDVLIGEFGAYNVQKRQADLSAEDDAIRMFGEINKGSFGPIQVIVVNHAIYLTDDVPLSRMSLEQWDRTIAVNLTSSFLVIREYLKALEDIGQAGKDLNDKAAIILVGSTAGKYGEPGHADYSVTKSGELSSSLDFKRS